MDQSEFKYRCWVWILFFIWNAWIIERERRWGGIHSGDGWGKHRFPTYFSGLLNWVLVHFVHVSTAWVGEKFAEDPKNGLFQTSIPSKHIFLKGEIIKRRNKYKLITYTTTQKFGVAQQWWGLMKSFTIYNLYAYCCMAFWGISHLDKLSCTANEPFLVWEYADKFLKKVLYLKRIKTL